MKSRTVIVMLLVLALAVPATMLAQQSKAEKEIRAFLEQNLQANLKGGPEAVAFFDKYYADDYIRIPPNGTTWGKAQMLASWKAGTTKVETAEYTVDQVRVYGKWALVTGTGTATWRTSAGEKISGASRWSRVMVKQGGVWKTLLFQDTAMPQPKQ
jgi:ketosteroid isomerase-like protein